jgi:predicted nuclease of predicted toxin-antitoxin system
MKILFDQGVPAPLRRHLAGHTVDTAFECGWASLENGEPLDAAEREGYELLITTDQDLKHQQRLAGRPLAIVVLLSTSWPRVRSRIDDIRAAVDRIGPGGYTEIPI